MANPAKSALKKLLFEGKFFATNTKNLNLYGPTGALFRRKIENIWWQWMVTNENNAYPIELGVKEENSMKSLIENHFTAVSYMSGRSLPFSFALVSLCDESNKGNLVDLLDLGIENCVHLCNMKFFHDKKFKGFPKELDEAIYNRLKWWKQFANSPSRYTASEIKQENETLSASVLYDFHGSPVQVETIQYFGSEFFNKFIKNCDSHLTCVNKEGREIVPSIVECRASLEQGMISILNDASESPSSLSDQENSKFQKLQLHPCLTPYIVNVTCNVPRTMQMREIVLYICKLVRNIGVDTLYTDDDSFSLEEQIIRNDKMGVLFTLVLTEKTINTGILKIRNRDTTIYGDIHITHIVEHLRISLDPNNIT